MGKNENRKEMMKKYNVTWTSQSQSSEDSMPLGGCDMGCNVWVEDNHIYVYLSESGAFDENNTLLKLTRICIQLEKETEIFETEFSQELHLNEGYISIQAGKEGDRVYFTLWAAVQKPELHITYRSDKAHQLYVSVQNWRYRDREVCRKELHQCRDFDFGYPGSVITKRDQVEVLDTSMLFYHRNEEITVWDKLIVQQHVEDIREQVINPLKNRTMGGILDVPGMKYAGEREGVYAHTDYREYVWEQRKSRRQEIVVTLHTAQTETLEQWKQELYDKKKRKVSQEESFSWWKDFFGKSYIITGEKEDTAAFRIGRNYQLFRYLLGCNAYGEYPTKFNGGLFTFDQDYTPDFRKWSGGGFTLQNQRLVYWGMLKSGDFDAMLPQFQYFTRQIETAKARVKKFFGVPGAFFYEQGNLFGLCTGAEYGWNHCEEISYGLEDNPWVRLHFSDGLEFALMMIEYGVYSGKSIEEYQDYIDSVLDFYFSFYRRDDTGKLKIFPASALETYKGKDPYSKDDNLYGCTNPMDAVSGLRCVLEQLIACGLDEEKQEKYRNYLYSCPELPTESKAGSEYFLPAQKFGEKPFNCELPELYPVFPYSPDGMTDHQKQIGRNTFLKQYASRDMYLGYSWHQNGIFAARLGLEQEAWKYLVEKLDDSERRFPAFWGPGHDWMPDHNWGGSGMIELQEMLMQIEKNKIVLFPCWKKEINVSFRLYAPGETCVSARLENGVVTKLEVTPENRKNDVCIGNPDIQCLW